MEKRAVIYSSIANLVLTAGLLLYDVRWSIGVLLGGVFFGLYYLLLTLNMDDMLSGQMNPEGFQSSSRKVLRMLLLAVPLVLGVVMPQYVSLYGAGIGLLMFKAVVVIMNMVEGRH